MDQPKRGRGRPKGSGRHDAPLFTKIAALMLDKPGISRSTATNRVVKMIAPEVVRRLNVQPESIVRRLNRNWHAVGEVILTDMRAERARERQSVVRRPTGPILWTQFAALQNHSSLVSHFPLTCMPEMSAAIAASSIVQMTPAFHKAIRNMPRISISPAVLRAMENAAKVLSGIKLPHSVWVGLSR